MAAVSAVRIRSRGNVLASMVLAAAPKRSMDGRAWNLGGRKGSSQGQFNIPAGNILPQPTSSRVRRVRSPLSSRSRKAPRGGNNRLSSKDSSSMSTSKSSRRRKACNKQPSVPEESRASEGIRGRPSAVERGRTVLSIMENSANRMMQSPGQTRER